GERVAELRPESGGVAGADRRGYGADLEGVGGTATVWLAGPPLPVSDRVHLAAPPATAPSSDVCARNEPRGLRVRPAPPAGLWRLVRAVRRHGSRDTVLPRAVRASWMEPDTGADHLPREHARGRYRRRGPRPPEAATEPRALLHAPSRAGCLDEAGRPQHRGHAEVSDRDGRSPDDLHRQPGYRGGAGSALPRRDRRRRARPVPAPSGLG